MESFACPTFITSATQPVFHVRFIFVLATTNQLCLLIVKVAAIKTRMVLQMTNMDKQLVRALTKLE